MIRPFLTRRQLVLLAATALGTILPRGRVLAGPNDQGIGGTGFSLRPADEEADRGIGGTGVIGTIRKFGSIIVNDLRIAYPADVKVRIDGRVTTAADLRLGQVVRVAATQGRDGGLSTHTIDVTSEVVGPVEAVRGKNLQVLGQTVSMADLKGARATWAVGDTVAVSGLRRNDGTIVASLIERRDAGLTRVVGPVVQAPDGALRIGGQALSGVSGSLIGQRAIVDGRLGGTTLVVTRGVSEASILPRDITTLSVEAYVERRGDSLHLGSGLAVENLSSIGLPAGRSTRAILTTSVGADGRIAAKTLQTGGKQYRATAAANGAGERRPMDFSHPAPPAESRPGSIGHTPRDGFFGPGDIGPRGPGGGGGFGGPGGPGGPGGGGGRR